MAKTKNKHLDEELFASYRKLPSLPFYQLVRPDAASLKKSQKLFYKDGMTPVFSYGRAKKFDAIGYVAALEAWKKRCVLNTRKSFRFMNAKWTSFSTAQMP